MRNKKAPLLRGAKGFFGFESRGPSASSGTFGVVILSAVRSTESKDL